MNFKIDWFDVTIVALGTAVVWVLEGATVPTLFTNTGAYLFGKIAMTYLLDQINK